MHLPARQRGRLVTGVHRYERRWWRLWLRRCEACRQRVCLLAGEAAGIREDADAWWQL
jgi:hypothetical protein